MEQINWTLNERDCFRRGGPVVGDLLKLKGDEPLIRAFGQYWSGRTIGQKEEGGWTLVLKVNLTQSNEKRFNEKKGSTITYKARLSSIEKKGWRSTSSLI